MAFPRLGPTGKGIDYVCGSPRGLEAAHGKGRSSAEIGMAKVRRCVRERVAVRFQFDVGRFQLDTQIRP